MEQILHLLPAVCNRALQSLLNLACVDRRFAIQLSKPSSNSIWHEAWLVAKQNRPAAEVEAQQAGPALSELKPRDLLRLAGFTGCMLCEANSAKRIQKVYWEFSIRCCKTCLTKHSMAELRIKREYALEPEEYQHLPSRKVEMYKPCAGTFTFNCYWKPHLLPILQNKYGAQSCEEHTGQGHEQQAQQGASKRGQKEPQCRSLKMWWLESSIDLTQAATYSDTYIKNCSRPRPLKRKTFDPILPQILQEIDLGLRSTAAKRARLNAPQPPAPSKSGSSSKRRKPPASDPSI